MTIPCPEKIDCACSDNPFANLTSENPDREVWLGDNYGWSYYFPNLGSNWTRNSCLGVCKSLISQADADLCAALNNILCAVDDSGTCAEADCPPGGPPGVPGGPPTIPGRVYYNSVQSCTVNCPDGLPFRYQVAAGMFATPSNQALVDQMAYSYACRLATERLVCLSDLTRTNGCAGSFFTGKITARAPTGCSFSITSGTLPPGLNLFQESPKVIRIEGTPTSGGNYVFSIRATDTLLNYMEKSFEIKIIEILNAGALPNTSTGDAYVYQFAASGGTEPYTWSAAGSPYLPWPDGITIEPSGLVGGSATTNGNYSFGIVVTDANGQSCVKSCTMIVGTCNNATSGTGFCPGDPSKVSSAAIPENTYCENTQGEADARANREMLAQIRAGLAAQGCVCPGPVVNPLAGTGMGTVTNSCNASYGWNLNSPAIINLIAGVPFDPKLQWETFNGLVMPHGTVSILTPTSYAGPSIRMFYP